jgi:subtilisin family serine protease
VTSIQASRQASPASLDRPLLAAIFGFIVIYSVLVQYISWIVQQTLLLAGGDWPWWARPLVSLIHAVPLLAVLVPLAIFWRNKRYRAIIQTWAIGAGFILLLIPVHLVQSPAVLAANFLQILLLLFITVLILFLIWLRFDAKFSVRPTTLTWLAVALAAFVSYPWLAWGALGSPLDSLLNLGAGLLLGLVSGITLAYFLWDPLRRASKGKSKDITLGGFAAGAFLLMVASGLGFNGAQLLLMISLPGLGWLLADLAFSNDSLRFNRSWWPVALLVGVAAAAPLMLFDPDELNLILDSFATDSVTWAIRAAAAALLIGLFLGLILFWQKDKPIWQPARPVTLVIVIVAWSGALLIYLLVGQPGSYGDQFFVILDTTADLSRATSISDQVERREFVFQQLVNEADRSQADIRASLDRLGIDYTPYYLVNGLAVDGGPLVRMWLTSRPNVERVLDNPILRPLPALSPTASGGASRPGEPPWNLTMIGADRVWNELGVTGEGIVIGQSDSGVEGSHPELSGSYRGRDIGDDYNWFDPWYETTQPTDVSGHGTHTLGSIVGKNTGVAPGAEWIGCTNLARNLGNPALYLDCMQFMLAPFPQGGNAFVDGDPGRSAHILNNSWGCPEIEGCTPETFGDAVRALRAAGIFVVASAGNDGPSCNSVDSPLAIYDEVYSVGAVDEQGELTFFSSRGPVTVDGSGRTKPDIVAPGNNILSAFPNGTYEYLPGTSMAGPHVAGVIALMWSANPALIGDIDRTEQILSATARPYSGVLPNCGDTDTLPNNGVGSGIVDAYASVKSALELR